MKQLLIKFKHLGLKKSLTVAISIAIFLWIWLADNSNFYFLARVTLYSAVPLILVALGGLFSERSGVVNIALEGIMLIGAFSGIFVMATLQNNGATGQGPFLMAMAVGAAIGAIYAGLHAYASVSMKANQIISGTALNLLAPAIAIFIARFATGTQQIYFQDTMINRVDFLANIPVIGRLFFTNIYVSTYIGLGLFIIATIILYKTPFGLRLRACGEHPQAADAAGVNVYKIRYAGVIISGFLAGLGGVILIVATTNTFNANVSGYGFLALAVLISGQWRPGRVFLVAIFFGFILKMADAASLIPVLSQLRLPSLVYSMLPFVATLVLLSFTSKKSRAPRAAGEPFDAGKR